MRRCGSLHSTQVDDAGAQALAEGFSSAGVYQNATLQHLDLSRNPRLGAAGAAALAAGLEEHPALTELALPRHRVGASPAAAPLCILPIGGVLYEPEATSAPRSSCAL